MFCNLPGVFPIPVSRWGTKWTRDDASLEGRPGHLHSYLYGGLGGPASLLLKAGGRMAEGD